MKKIIFWLSLFMTIECNSYSQGSIKEYVLSFPKLKTDSIVNLKRFSKEKHPMSEKEALKFVYNNDTNRLYCRGVHFNMDTEQVTGEWTEKTLPDKCFIIDNDFFYLIAYTYYVCQNPKETKWTFVNLSIYDKDFQFIDSLCVCRGNPYEYDISSIMFLNSLKIFVSNNNNYTIYKINPISFKFEKIKAIIDSSISTDNLLKVAKKLGWYDILKTDDK